MFHNTCLSHYHTVLCDPVSALNKSHNVFLFLQMRTNENNDPYRDCTRTLKTQTAPSLSPSYGFGWIIHALCCFGIWGVSGELQSNGDESISQSHIYWEICWLSLSVHHTAVSALPTPPKHKYGSFDRPNTTLSFSCYPHRVLVHSLSRGDEVSCLLMKMGTDSA